MNDASIDELIDGLADDLEPVRPRRITRASLWVGAGWLAAGALLLWIFGMRQDLAAMPVLSMLTFWLVAMVAIATIWSALRMGLPGVGRDYGGWRWTALAALALPLSALFVGFSGERSAIEAARAGVYPCFPMALASGLGVGAALFGWLRAGAPTSPARAGWVIGLGSGASGATIVALHCPLDDIVHIALWHGGAVLLAAVAGRLVLPPLLRW
ncbi:NrsF family protein [Sphingopyxis sp. 113P3]|uniref:NrsF family protein n=1 Tax=Sphingopyxis sp. (strain 113P3) TaxID=292913 RepID=UPI0006AD5CE8|nr:DUF1109 domain-containing protein [Sphingopyxis sp. 113P3]ALC13330.1 hypothetical protein LH20_15340 [Sphingopyxis sp. 113P3]